MVKLAISLAAATLALLAAAPVRVDAAPPARVELVYPTRMQARIRYRGRIYVATLESWPDAWHDISYIDLELARPGRRRSRNLLSPPGNWHGMVWPFYFAASDLAQRPGGVLFPNPRRILIQGTHEELELTVLDSRTRPTRTDMHDGFERLRLFLTIRRE
jgi:hypothetical protein